MLMLSALQQLAMVMYDDDAYPCIERHATASSSSPEWGDSPKTGVGRAFAVSLRRAELIAASNLLLCTYA